MLEKYSIRSNAAPHISGLNSMTWAAFSNKQHSLCSRDFTRNSGKSLHHTSPDFAFIQCIYNTTTTAKKKKKKNDYQKQCQHVGERRRAKSVTKVSSGLFWNQQQRLARVTHCIPRNQSGRQEKASQSNMCWSSWKGYTIPAAFKSNLGQFDRT